jgi:chaperonin cofactor prefoldin
MTDELYEALKAEPPTKLTATQRHVSVARAELPPAHPVLDRNGIPTGDVRFNPNEPFPITLNGLGEIRALIERDAKKESAAEIVTLRKQVENARRESREFREERDRLASDARSYDRSGREEKILARIGEACEQHAAKLQQEIRSLREEIGTLKSQNDELRAAKKRLKAARQGAGC